MATKRRPKRSWKDLQRINELRGRVNGEDLGEREIPPEELKKYADPAFIEELRRQADFNRDHSYDRLPGGMIQ